MTTTSEGNGSRRYGTTNLAPVLRPFGVTQISYRQVLRMIAEGRLPARKELDGRWYFDEADLPTVAEALRPRAS